MLALHLLPVAFISNILSMDGLVVLILGLLIFGWRLPTIGGRLAQAIGDFKKEISKGYNGEGEDIPWSLVIGFVCLILFGLWTWSKYRG